MDTASDNLAGIVTASYLFHCYAQTTTVSTHKNTNEIMFKDFSEKCYISDRTGLAATDF